MNVGKSKRKHKEMYSSFSDTMRDNEQKMMIENRYEWFMTDHRTRKAFIRAADLLIQFASSMCWNTRRSDLLSRDILKYLLLHAFQTKCDVSTLSSWKPPISDDIGVTKKKKQIKLDLNEKLRRIKHSSIPLSNQITALQIEFQLEKQWDKQWDEEPPFVPLSTATLLPLECEWTPVEVWEHFSPWIERELFVYLFGYHHNHTQTSHINNQKTTQEQWEVLSNCHCLGENDDLSSDDDVSNGCNKALRDRTYLIQRLFQIIYELYIVTHHNYTICEYGQLESRRQFESEAEFCSSMPNVLIHMIREYLVVSQGTTRDLATWWCSPSPTLWTPIRICPWLLFYALVSGESQGSYIGSEYRGTLDQRKNNTFVCTSNLIELYTCYLSLKQLCNTWMDEYQQLIVVWKEYQNLNDTLSEWDVLKKSLQQLKWYMDVAFPFKTQPRLESPLFIQHVGFANNLAGPIFVQWFHSAHINWQCLFSDEGERKCSNEIKTRTKDLDVVRYLKRTHLLGLLLPSYSRSKYVPKHNNHAISIPWPTKDDLLTNPKSSSSSSSSSESDL